MSKFLTQTKTFLPMIMQKSTTDAIQILERYPSLCTAQHQELPKQEIQKQETPTPEPLKADPVHPEILKQISSSSKDSLNIVVDKSSEPPKILEAAKIPEKGPESLKVVTVDAANAANQKTLLKALILDLLEIQRRLLLLLSEGRVWLWQTVLNDRSGPSASSIVRMVQPQVKDQPQVPLLAVLQKKKDKKDDKAEEKPPVKSNLWEAIQENSPAWQESISNQLGELQKVVVKKMSK